MGADGYDATALAAQKMAAAHEMEARKARNRGSGNILAQDA